MNRTESFSSMQLTGLDVRLPYGSLETLTTDDDELLILIAGDDGSCERLQVLFENGICYIHQLIGTHLFRVNQPRWLEVTIHIPVSWKGRVSLMTGSGSLTSSTLSGSDVRLQTGSGQLRIDQLTAINAKLSTRTGDILLGQIFSDSCLLTTISGNIHVDAGNSPRWKCIYSSGETEINMISEFEHFTSFSLSGPLRLFPASGQVDVVHRSFFGRIRTNDISLQSGVSFLSHVSFSGDLIITRNT